MTPAKVATKRPRFRSRSCMEARFSGKNNAEQTDDDAHEDDSPGVRTHHFGTEFTAENGGHQSSEHGRVAESDGHTERHAEIAHGETESEAAEAPEDAECVGPEEAAGGSFLENLRDVARHHKG